MISLAGSEDSDIVAILVTVIVAVLVIVALGIVLGVIGVKCRQRRKSHTVMEADQVTTTRYIWGALLIPFVVYIILSSKLVVNT